MKKFENPHLYRQNCQCMKILNIYFKNINSLEGESRINFEQSPFSDSGVFAITGPNGSGKSTILDAITLGLYGETFRFDRPARHVMTKHTVECFSEIEFSLGKEKYRSSWHAQRLDGDPDGEVMPSEMKLMRLNGGEEVLAVTPQQVCSRITELTGMNFRNFTRSIMLAQGDFAAFLNALDSERMDILEKIISVDIYADYKKEVTEKADNARIRLDQLKQDLAAIPVIEQEKLEAFEDDLADFKDQYADLRDEQNHLKQQQSALKKITALQNRIAGQEKKLQEAKTQAENKQKKLDQIAASQSALIFKDDLKTVKDKNQEIEQGKATLAAFRNELKQLEDMIARSGSDKNSAQGSTDKSVTEQKQTLDSIKEQMAQLMAARQSESELLQSLAMQQTEKKSALATVTNWLEEHSADESLLANFPETDKLKKLRAEWVDLNEKQKSFAKWSKNVSSALKNNKSAIEKQHKKVAELKRQLEIAEKTLESITQGHSREEIEDLRAEQQERVKAFQDLNQLAQANQKLTKGNFSFFGGFFNKNEPEHDVEELSLALENLKKEIKRAENIKSILEEAVFRESLLKKMAADRPHLVDGKPCPLCGALQHPYAKRPPALTNSQQALADQQTKIRSLIIAVDTTGRKLAVAQKQAERNKANQALLQQIRSEWLTLCNRLNTVSNDLDIKNIGLMKRLLRAETNELKNIVSLAAKYRSKQDRIEKLKLLIAKSEATVEQLQINIQKLDAEWQARAHEQQDLEAALAQCQQEEKELTDKVIEQLALLDEKMPLKRQEDALYDRLTMRRQDYQSYAFRRKALTGELEALEAKLSACRTEIKAGNDKLELYASQLQSEEATGLHLALIEKQKLIADKEQLINQQESEVHRLQQALQEKMQATQFTSMNELSEILELMQSQSELEQDKAELEQVAMLEMTELEKNQAQLEAESAYITSELSLEEIDAQLRSVAEKMDIASLEAQYLESLLKDQKQLQLKYDAVFSQFRNQEIVTRQYIAEAAQMAAESGMGFRRRVQGKVADQLLAQTNAVLEKISGRYYIRQMPSEQGLALEIEDTYQGNVRRLPKTLSGGESFVVSLALALGLSELANSGEPIDSMFLDEGFGNLDAETLYTVISTLESLHTHGKTVGVISHVEAVQKRFKVQLQVVKKPNGMGELKKAS